MGSIPGVPAGWNPLPDPPSPPGDTDDDVGPDPAAVPRAVTLRDVTRLRDLAPWIPFGVGSLGMGLLFMTNSPELKAWQRLVVGLVAVAFASYFFFVAYRVPRTGIEANEGGLWVTNLYRTYHVRWDQLRDIGFKGVNNEDGHAVYHRFVLYTEGRRIAAFAPSGSPDPGGRLDSDRRTLLAMRDQFTGRAHQTTPGRPADATVAGAPSSGVQPTTDDLGRRALPEGFEPPHAADPRRRHEMGRPVAPGWRSAVAGRVHPLLRTHHRRRLQPVHDRGIPRPAAVCRYLRHLPLLHDGLRVFRPRAVRGHVVPHLRRRDRRHRTGSPASPVVRRPGTVAGRRRRPIRNHRHEHVPSTRRPLDKRGRHRGTGRRR
jgi:hypothetical protein